MPQVEVTACVGAQGDTDEEAKEGQHGGNSANERKNSTRGGCKGSVKILRLYSGAVE